MRTGTGFIKQVYQIRQAQFLFVLFLTKSNKPSLFGKLVLLNQSLVPKLKRYHSDYLSYSLVLAIVLKKGSIKLWFCSAVSWKR